MSKSMIEVSERRKNFLKLWMRERNMDLRMREDNMELKQAAQTSGPVDRPWEPAEAFNRDVQPGDVRLLADACVIGDLPVYVTILNVDPSMGIALVAPFSRYDSPATNNEWATDFEACSLRVLQLWNTQPFPLYAVAKSWLVGTLPDEKLKRARELYTRCITGEYPPASDREDIGLAIVDLDDPRCKYQEEEFTKLAPLHALMDQHLYELEHVPESIFETVRWFATAEKPARAAAADGDIRCDLLIRGSQTPCQATQNIIVPNDNGTWIVEWTLGTTTQFKDIFSEGAHVYAFDKTDTSDHLLTAFVERDDNDYIASFQGSVDDGLYEKIASEALLLIVEPKT